MDELEVWLGDLSRQEVPRDSLRRVSLGVQARLRKRRFGRFGLAAAALLALCFASFEELERRATEEIILPQAIEAVFPAPDLVISAPAVPAGVSSWRPQLAQPMKSQWVGEASWVGEAIVQLPSSDPNVVILWDLSQEESGGLL